MSTAQRAGGLEVAVAPILKEIESVWFGWSSKVVPGGDYQENYNGFANRVLWPVLQYRIDLTEFHRRDLTGYLRVNQHFATELSKI